MEPVPSDVFSFKDTAIVVTWALTAIGWGFNARSAHAREWRKEVRKEVDDCIKATYDLLHLTKTYYYDASRGDDGDRTSRIRFDLHRLLMRLERLERRCPKLDTGNQRGVLMDALTGDDFDTVLRSVLVPRDFRVKSMDMATHNVIEALEDGFIRQFDSKGLARRLFDRLMFWR